jgi:arabinan endo-1,5-alpha-L-arabinosidase
VDEKGLVVTSANNSSVQTNAIDPSVIVANNGEHWMVYGSAQIGSIHAFNPLQIL